MTFAPTHTLLGRPVELVELPSESNVKDKAEYRLYRTATMAEGMVGGPYLLSEFEPLPPIMVSALQLRHLFADAADQIDGASYGDDALNLVSNIFRNMASQLDG